MTGSKLLAKLIHGFGHSCSYDTIIRLETALALKQAANTAFRENSLDEEEEEAGRDKDDEDEENEWPNNKSSCWL